jgi:hypothetical protein
MFGAALLAGGVAYAFSLLLRGLHPLPMAACVAGVYGAVYFVMARAFELGEAVAFWGMLRRRLGRRRT